MPRHLLPAIVALPLGVIIYATAIEPRWLRVRRVEIASRRLPPKVRQLRICLVGDMHLHNGAAADRLAAMVLDLQPDIVAVTGDMVAGHTAVESAVRFVQTVSRRLPVYMVRGNHDTREETATYAREGARVLDNESVELREGLFICGVDDPIAGTPDPAAALRDVPDDAFVLLLAHAPDVILLDGWRKADLILCGHTHGGQVRLPLLGPIITLSHAPRRYASGLNLCGRTAMYTTTGAGQIVPLRFFCRPEVALVTVRRTVDGFPPSD